MILLFGSTGYIGKEFKKQLDLRKYNVFYWKNTKNTTFKDLEQWYNSLNRPKIDAVINVAGYTGKPNVDICEIRKDDTIHGNIVWTQIITDWCILHDLVLGHVSSGCIYQGRKPNGEPYTEEDVPNFCFVHNNSSFYSGTKVVGEQIVSKWNKSYIWRLRLPFEEYNNDRNYLSKLLKYDKLLLAENSISNKTDFVNACIDTIDKKVPHGIYNVTNTGYVSTEYVVNKLKNTIAKDKEFKFIDQENFLKECSNIPRSNCITDNKKLLSVGIKMRTVDEAIDYCLNNWKNTYE